MKKLTHVDVLGCEKCGYTWLPRVKSPLKCPKCGHRFVTLQELELRRDG